MQCGLYFQDSEGNEIPLPENLDRIVVKVGSSGTIPTGDPEPTGEPAPKPIFYASSFGAKSDFNYDSSDAIINALNTAGAAATGLPVGEYAKLYIDGEYSVSPKGTLNVRFWEKNHEGQWQIAADNISDSGILNWHVYDSDPTQEIGTNGDYAINRRKNAVFSKKNDKWENIGPIINRKTDTWRADFFPPVETDPQSVWIQYFLKHDTKRATWLVTPDWNQVQVEWTENAQINVRCWGSVDPMDYSITNGVAGEDLPKNSRVYFRDDQWWASGSAEEMQGVITKAYSSGKACNVITKSAIPPEKFWPDSAGTSNSMHRGNFMVLDRLKGETRDLSGFHLINPKIWGGTTANYKNAWYVLEHDLDQWDINHKGLTYTWGADGNVYDMKVLGGKIWGFRGEEIYAGGAMTKEIYVSGTTVGETNSSAISCSANLFLKDIKLYNCYNGVENFQHINGDHFTHIENMEIDMQQGGSNGVVLIGESGTHSFISGLKVVGSNTNSNSNGMYFDGSAYDVSIIDSEFVDTQMGIRLYNINAGHYKLTPEWKNFTFKNVTFRAKTRTMSFGINQMQSYQDLGEWSLDNVNAVTENGNRIIKAVNIQSNHPNSRVYVDNCDLSASNMAFAGDGNYPIFGMNNNLGQYRYNPFRYSAEVLPMNVMMPENVLTYLPDPSVASVYFGSLDKFIPAGHSASWSLGVDAADSVKRSVPLVPDSSWNSFDEVYYINNKDRAYFQFNPETNLVDLVEIQTGAYN